MVEQERRWAALQTIQQQLYDAIPLATELQQDATAFQAFPDASVGTIRNDGHWDDCDVNRSRCYSDRSSLSCAVRDDGVFKSNSKYQIRKNINITNDFASFFQARLQGGLRRDNVAVAGFAAMCRGVLEANAADIPYLAASRFQRRLHDIQQPLICLADFRDVICRDLQFGQLMPSGAVLNHLVHRGSMVVSSCGQMISNSIAQRQQSIRRGIRRLFTGPAPVPDEAASELLAFIVREREEGYLEAKGLCCDCDDLVHESLLFSVCLKHTLCNEVAELMIKSMIKNGGMGDFPPQCPYCTETELGKKDNHITPDYIKQNQLRLHLTDKEVRQFTRFWNKGAFDHPVECRECDEVFNDSTPRDDVKQEGVVTTETVACPACQTISCAACHVRAPHPEISCDDLQQQQQQGDVATADLLRATTSQCSRCGTHNTHSKHHGCHHIGYGTRGCQGRTADGEQCGFHYCCLCLEEWRTCDCRMSCDDTCNCPPCFECKPGRPCRWA
jgi:hypothetical protein